MVAKRGLGKGLDSMIPEKIGNISKEEKKTEPNNVSRETLININEIEPNKSQPRKNFNEDGILELADSIKQYGIIQPLILQKKDKYYEIVAGERRWRAARAAGLKKVPAIIKNYTTQEIMEIALIENIQREDLNPIEEAIAYQNLISEFNLKQDEVAERVSKSRTAITNSMRLLKLDRRVQQMLIDDMISSGHARTILPIEDGDVQYHIATKIFDEKLSVRETEKLIKNLNKNPISKKQEVDNSIYIYKDLEEKIKRIIGTKVTINKKSKNKGKIEIEYYSEEELERIIDLFENMEQ
ncbi:ParB family chromosome partitioning protein [Mobilisporobacter senegalensis]|uniref:ParB family chromosome partitioning protein n=1 Tax=Mobilisporobacter senegalensis TaxID=1329262 RepID=A0A3N1XB06_9FIRM|nr:ParB/RepB/Spo0J family partition protein [Mobilisporobacter senegalensis]ROR22142.1 ParB family chromosome partitioning protein [Mobilisporobacter senegalensis]